MYGTYKSYQRIQHILASNYLNCVVLLRFPYGLDRESEYFVDINLKPLPCISPETEYVEQVYWEDELAICCLKAGQVFLENGISATTGYDLECSFKINLTQSKVDYLYEHVSSEVVFRIIDSTSKGFIFNDGVVSKKLENRIITNLPNLPSYRPTGANVVIMTFGHSPPGINNLHVRTMDVAGYEYNHSEWIKNKNQNFHDLGKILLSAYNIDPPDETWDNCEHKLIMNFHTGVHEYHRTYSKKVREQIRFGVIELDDFFLMGEMKDEDWPAYAPEDDSCWGYEG